jgi:hypothetical protein
MFFGDSKKPWSYYILAFSVILVASYVGNSFRQTFATEGTQDEYEMVKKYLLNDSPLYGYNKPKIWIHSKYEVNARQWKNFGSRNSTDLNQPYLYLTIQSIINHCGNDFHICLIDDETFEKLIPSWDIDLTSVADPMKSHIRDIGMLELVYYYGGFIVPNSFLCTRNLMELYNNGTENGKKPFVIERPNRHVNNFKDNKTRLFAPEISFMGAPKNDETIKEFIQYLKESNLSGQRHFSQEMDFYNQNGEWCLDAMRQGKISYVGGETIGVKTKNKKPVLLEDLMEEKFLNVDMNTLFGIYIPRDELLKRPKYQWFSILPYEDILKSNLILAKFFKMSMVDATSEYHNEDITKVASVTAI